MIIHYYARDALNFYIKLEVKTSIINLYRLKFKIGQYDELRRKLLLPHIVVK